MQHIEISLRGFLNFHTGIINILIHAIGIALAIYGVWRMNWVLIIIAPIIMEIGHAYNHMRGIKTYPFKVLPLQAATYAVFLTAVYVLKVIIL